NYCDCEDELRRSHYNLLLTSKSICSFEHLHSTPNRPNRHWRCSQLKGKFVRCPAYYSVNATSIKRLKLKYDNLPKTEIDVMASDITTDIVRNENGQSILDFCLDEYLGEKEPNSFWLK
ncbi:9061_t:CDS:2, partial [Funneliformis caledonium]